MAFGFGFGMPRIFTAPFTPAALFLGGQQGAWYDPSDYGVNGTLFQDSAGTTPVTAVQQPVGLMLDKSKGLVLGPELVVNGDFSNGTTGWTTAGPVLSVVSGQLEANWSGSGAFNQVVAVSSGKTYKLFITHKKGTYSGATIGLIASNGMPAVTLSLSTSEVTTSVIFTATGGTVSVGIGRLSADTGTIYFDNISVKELPGNHAFQTTSASRPVLSARYNLLTKTEQFDDAAWTKTSNGTGTAPVVTPNAAIAPDGTMTADRVIFNAGVGVTVADQSMIGQFGGGGLTIGVSYAGSISIKGTAGIKLVFRQQGGGAYTLLTLTGGWDRFNVPETSVITSLNFELGIRQNVVGVINSSATVDIWGADLRVSNDALGQPAYQRVNTSTDYDTVGFKPYLAFDGVDDSLVTNSIDFTATDKMTVFAGVRRAINSIGMLLELSSAYNSTNNGAFALYPEEVSSVPKWTAGSRGTLSAASLETVLSAPRTEVVSTSMDIAAPLIMIRLNGVAGTSPSGATQGTGNYGNYPLFIGRRNQASFPFNGRLYSLIVRGAATNTNQLDQTEVWVNGKTGAYIDLPSLDTENGDNFLLEDGSYILLE